MSNDTCINPLEEQRKQALQHYLEASSAIHHSSSFVERAIKAYNPTAPAEEKGADVVEEIRQLIISNRCEPNKGCAFGFTYDDITRISTTIAGLFAPTAPPQEAAQGYEVEDDMWQDVGKAFTGIIGTQQWVSAIDKLKTKYTINKLKSQLLTT